MRNRKKNAEGDKKAMVIIALSVVFLVGVLAAAKLLKGHDDVDKTTNCPKAGIADKFVIVIDKTDNILEQTRAEIVSRSWNAIKDPAVVPVGGQVSIYEITPDNSAGLTPIVQVCKPKESANPVTESQRLVDRKFRDQFEKPLLDALNREVTVAGSSPVAEAVADIQVSSSLSGARQARMLVFSDLLQNSPNANVYKCTNPDAMIEQFKNGRGGISQRPQLVDSFVELHVIPRAGVTPAMAACRDKFWLWFFGDMRGDAAHSGLKVLDLPGGYVAPAPQPPAGQKVAQ